MNRKTKIPWKDSMNEKMRKISEERKKNTKQNIKEC